MKHAGLSVAWRATALSRMTTLERGHRFAEQVGTRSPSMSSDTVPRNKVLPHSQVAPPMTCG